MNSRRHLPAALLTAALALPVLAAETGDVELREGYIDPDTGVRVTRIVDNPDTGLREIHFAVPREHGPMEEVIVTAKRPSGELIPQLRPHEFVDDFDHDHYGLVIYLGKNQTLPFRLFMDARQHEPGEIRP